MAHCDIEVERTHVKPVIAEAYSHCNGSWRRRGVRYAQIRRAYFTGVFPLGTARRRAILQGRQEAEALWDGLEWGQRQSSAWDLGGNASSGLRRYLGMFQKDPSAPPDRQENWETLGVTCAASSCVASTYNGSGSSAARAGSATPGGATFRLSRSAAAAWQSRESRHKRAYYKQCGTARSTEAQRLQTLKLKIRAYRAAAQSHASDSVLEMRSGLRTGLGIQ